MTSRTDNIFGIFMLLGFIFFVVVAYWSYLTTPDAKLLPLIVSLFFWIYVFLIGFGEYLGVFVTPLAKKNFISRGGLIGVYEKHREHHSGMVTYSITTYTRNLKYCNYRKFSEYSALKRFFTFLSPVRMFDITDKKEMFEEVPIAGSDTPEGTIFYSGNLRDVKLWTFEETLRHKLERAAGIISKLHTSLESAKSAAEAAAQGQNKHLNDYITILGNAQESLTTYKKEELPMKREGERQW